MSVLQLRFTFLMNCFSKCSPLFPIYGNGIQIVGMLPLFTMFPSLENLQLKTLTEKPN